MDFSWTQNEKELYRIAVALGQQKLSGTIGEGDKKNEFFYTGWKECANFGLQGMIIPKVYGGMDLGLFEVISILEGIGYGCKDNGLIFSINAHIWGAEIPLLHFASPQQKQCYLPRLANGSLVAANAMTEPGAGSDAYSLNTIFTEEEGCYILNGTKTFVTNAPIADIFIVYAKKEKSTGLSGISCFVVEKNSKGLVIGSHIEKMGLRTSPMAQITFEGCKVRKENLVGEEGSGGIIFSDSMEWERLFVLANAVGVMERILTQCIEYAKVRKMGTQTISKYQSVANRIVEMRVRLELSRLLLYKSVWLKGQKTPASLESSLVKLYISESYISICNDAVRMFGGYGYTVEYEFERELRDALGSVSYSGTSDIQRNIIAGLLGL